MKAAVMEGVRQPLVVRTMPDPEPQPGGAVIRVEANGVCRSDWHAWVGDWTWFGMKLQFPHVLGHEFCGVVEEAGPDVRRFRKGDRVLVPFSQGDGTCEQCRGGHANVCAEGRMTPGIHYGGGFGRLVGVPVADANLVRLPDAIDFVEAASLGCRFMTSFHALVDQAAVRAGEWVAVHGCGGVGLSAVHIASALGANVIAVDIDDKKLETARALGAAVTLNARDTKVVSAIMQQTRGGAHVSVDALGVAATCRASIGCLRIRGRHVQIGLTSSADKGEIAIPMDLVVLKEIAIVGSYGMQPARYDAMLRMVERGTLTPGKLVSRRIPLEETSDVLASMDSFGTLGVTVIDRY